MDGEALIPNKHGGLYIKETTINTRGKKTLMYRVKGWSLNEKPQVKTFASRKDAETFKARKQVELINESVPIRTVFTPLTDEQLQEAQACIQRLQPNFTLTEAVDFFLEQYSPVLLEGGILLEEAIRNFLERKSESEAIRARSLVQLKSTLSLFCEWIYSSSQDIAIKRQMEGIRYQLRKENSPPLQTAIRLVRKVLPTEQLQHLDSIKSQLAPHGSISQLSNIADRRLQAALVEQYEMLLSKRRIDLEDWLQECRKELSGMKDIYVHYVKNEHILDFLNSIRSKSGSKASPKTFNNYRADLHSFFELSVREGWCVTNPVTSISKRTVTRGRPDILSPPKCRELMDYVESYEDGKLCRYFALALFAGLRTGPNGELHKLANRAKELIDLKNGVIHIPPEIAKTHTYRQVKIQPNLRRWLERYTGPVLPPNHDRLIKHVRKQFALTHAQLRHTFFSAWVSAFHSVGSAAIVGGNTEAIVKRHYLNQLTESEGMDIWSITPTR